METRFKVACGVVAVWMVAAWVASVLWVLPGFDAPWWVALLRSPVASGSMAVVAVVLAVRWFSAPGGTAFRCGEKIGAEAGYARGFEYGRKEGRAEVKGGTVVPMPRRMNTV